MSKSLSPAPRPIQMDTNDLFLYTPSAPPCLPLKLGPGHIEAWHRGACEETLSPSIRHAFRRAAEASIKNGEETSPSLWLALVATGASLLQKMLTSDAAT